MTIIGAIGRRSDKRADNPLLDVDRIQLIWSQVLVGAEVENARRDELIKTRQRILGGD